MELTDTIVPALINAWWQGLVLLGLVWLGVRFLAPRLGMNAAARHAVLLLALLGIALLPAWNVWQQGQGAAPGESGLAFGMHEEAPLLEMSPLSPSEPLPTLETQPAIRVEAALPPGESLDVSPPIVGQAAEAGSVRYAVETPVRYVLPASTRGWLRGLAGVWLLGAGLLLLRLAWGCVWLARVKHRAVPLPDVYQQRLQRWASREALPRPVRAAASESISTPVAAGLGAPVILVPAMIVGNLTEEELDQVLLHELAHLQRRDDWTNLAYRIVEAIFFFQPALYWLGRELDRTRELACDDWVVARTARPRQYASCLARLVEIGLEGWRPGVAPGMAVARDQLFDRVRLLLDPSHRARRGVTVGSLLLLGGLLLGAGWWAVRALPVVALPAPDAVQAMPPVESLPAMPPSEEPALPPDSVTSPASAEASFDIAQAPLSVRSLIRVLRAVAGIDSDGEKARVLLDAVDGLPANRDVLNAYVATTRTINSSGERVRALWALLEAHTLDAETFGLFLEAAEGISSDGEKARLLTSAARYLPADPALRNHFLRMADAIDGRERRAGILAALDAGSGQR